ncbi:hypothetical protein JG688_00006176 [Phytophthora aleatoria]|uniref:Uncharacterized protein n=1 Tax=Phytophthora aleatoria TaxID=2496075 RepID=A0A8J5IU28_9STRA|nr:hypothetical protein JG688_00006176 [Phytophthora aleatoria]
MFAFFDQVPTSTSLLLQCGYRSKACTNHRATKLDGTLHKLCEFHRRKANLNQQRLHKRQREQRAARQMHEFDTSGYNEYCPLVGAGGPSLAKIWAPDMDFLEQLLGDMQSMPPLETFLPSVSISIDDTNSFIVMFAFYDEVPTSTSLLLQCGYRSKVCTNHRATKLDGTLHKLCEFHRRKANLNQQRLHRRQREKRARIQQSESTSEESGLAKARPTKKARPSLEPIVDLVAQSPTDSYSQMSGSYYYPQYTPLVNSKLGSDDMDILELLLLDMQPQTLPPLEAFLPSNADDDSGSIAVLIRAME